MKRTPKDQAEVSPSTYKPEESLKKRVYTSEPKYSVGREKGRSFIDRYQKAKAFVPSPSNYNVEKAYKFVTNGARRGYK